MTVLKADELRGLFAEEYGVTKKEAKEQLDGIFDFFEDVMVKQQKGFVFGNLGKIEIVVNPEKAYLNPQTGELGDPKPEHYGFKFKTSKGKASVREKLKDVEVK
ncbi:HU family DNA-binding protein [Sporosarcina sp. FSL W7-1283]|uniref:HU family DNA-binding protein n=1 Tax=Sporosarcina sp. FSL W7-1283 TaxID=2921560 RepID=UPI0030F7852B